jgi:hypothetical protein
VLAVENLHVDISVDDVVLIDEVLDVDQKSWHIAIILFKMLEERIEVHFADFVIGGAGVVLVLGALGAFVVRRAGSSRLVVLVEVDVDVGDEVLEVKNDSLVTKLDKKLKPQKKLFSIIFS